MSFYYKLTADSPTACNLERVLQQQGWRSTDNVVEANFSDEHFDYEQRISQTLEFKHLLWQLVENIRPAIMPLSFVVDDSNWQGVLSKLNDHLHPVWILKPALLNNGSAIKLFTKFSALEQHFLSSNRLGGVHVLQQYVIRPHLLQGPQLGHKYSLRVFTVLTQQGTAYLYPHGYFNIAIAPYVDATFTQHASHLTNEHLTGQQASVVQIPSFQYPIFGQHFLSIKNIVQQVFFKLRQRFAKQFAAASQSKLAIFGFDFLVDEDKTVWLLEANHGPCFPLVTNHPLQQSLYQQFWHEFFKQFVVPISGNRPFSCVNSLFLPIN